MPLSGLRGSHLVGAAGAVAIIALLAFWAPWSAETRAGRSAQFANVAVNCEPGQQALVRQIATAGEPQVSVQCVTSGMAAAMQPTVYDQYGRPLPAGLVQSPGYMPAVYTPQAAAPVRAAARSTAPVRRTASAGSGRSWKKTALVIGGTAGAGAGIGAIVGGKKGALIGAAIGGGGASIYEAIKR